MKIDDSTKITVISCLLLLVLGSGLNGCVNPEVRYNLVAEQEGTQSPDTLGDFKFKLGASIVYIDNDFATYKLFKDANVQPSKIPIKVYSVATESKTPGLFLMRPVTTLWRKEYMQISYQGDSRLPKSIGFEVTDETQKMIQAVGTIAGLLVAAEETTLENTDVPATIDIGKHLKAGDTGKIAWANAVASNGWHYDIEIGPVPLTANETASFVNSILGKDVSIVFYSACRNAKITLKSGAYAGKEFSLAISDPNYVETVRIPESGSISFHPTCGVDVSTNKSDAPGTGAILAEVAAQAKSVRDASKSQEKSSSGTKTSSSQPQAVSSAPQPAKTPASAILNGRATTANMRYADSITDPGIKK